MVTAKNKKYPPLFPMIYFLSPYNLPAEFLIKKKKHNIVMNLNEIYVFVLNDEWTVREYKF